MHPLIEEHEVTIRKLCRDFGVSRLELFGSMVIHDVSEVSEVA